MESVTIIKNKKYLLIIMCVILVFSTLLTGCIKKEKRKEFSLNKAVTDKEMQDIINSNWAKDYKISDFEYSTYYGDARDEDIYIVEYIAYNKMKYIAYKYVVQIPVNIDCEPIKNSLTYDIKISEIDKEIFGLEGTWVYSDEHRDYSVTVKSISDGKISLDYNLKQKYAHTWGGTENTSEKIGCSSVTKELSYYSDDTGYITVDADSTNVPASADNFEPDSFSIGFYLEEASLDSGGVNGSVTGDGIGIDGHWLVKK